MIHQMMANRDQQIAQQKMDGNVDVSYFSLHILSLLLSNDATLWLRWFTNQ